VLRCPIAGDANANSGNISDLLASHPIALVKQPSADGIVLYPYSTGGSTVLGGSLRSLIAVSYFMNIIFDQF